MLQIKIDSQEVLSQLLEHELAPTLVLSSSAPGISHKAGARSSGRTSVLLPLSPGPVGVPYLKIVCMQTVSVGT